ncbi:MAG: sulfite exporter TauE/SafE family protein [Candidatus Zixiibacteriota bacterium]|nr:MAG: sulfite exporter TauE/SafE family protein [candidate division Zixibacteria bacterium]
MELFYLVITGILAGFVGSLFGLGGGIIIVPALTLIFNVPVTVAVGTSLVSIVAVSTVAAIDFLKSGRADLELGITLAAATSSGAATGGLLAEYLPARIIYIFFSVILIIAALNMTRPRRIMLIDHKYDSASHTAVGWGLSLVAGNVSGILGVGGGIIQIPMMRTVMKVPFKIATATSSYMIGITVAPAAAIYMLRGDIDPYKSAAIILGAFAGSRAGAAMSYKITSLLLRLLFVIIMIFTAYKMFVRGL